MAPRCKARANELHLRRSAEKASAVAVDDRVRADQKGPTCVPAVQPYREIYQPSC